MNNYVGLSKFKKIIYSCKHAYFVSDRHPILLFELWWWGSGGGDGGKVVV